MFCILDIYITSICLNVQYGALKYFIAITFTWSRFEEIYYCSLCNKKKKNLVLQRQPQEDSGKDLGHFATCNLLDCIWHNVM